MNPCSDEVSVKLAAHYTSVSSGKESKFLLKNQELQYSWAMYGIQDFFFLKKKQ